MSANQIGAILRQARIIKGLSQMEVANQAGLNLAQYQRLEYGTRDFRACSMRVGLSICYVLGLDPFLLVLQRTQW